MLQNAIRYKSKLHKKDSTEQSRIEQVVWGYSAALQG